MSVRRGLILAVFVGAALTSFAVSAVAGESMLTPAVAYGTVLLAGASPVPFQAT